MAKKLALRVMLFSYNVFAALFRALFTVVAIFAGLSLMCFAFLDQPPWISAPSVLGGIILFGMGMWTSENDLPLPTWWKRIADSVKS
jgi:hypothetical protein